jgi:hypothetical protein
MLLVTYHPSASTALRRLAFAFSRAQFPRLARSARYSRAHRDIEIDRRRPSWMKVRIDCSAFSAFSAFSVFSLQLFLHLHSFLRILPRTPSGDWFGHGMDRFRPHSFAFYLWTYIEHGLHSAITLACPRQFALCAPSCDAVPPFTQHNNVHFHAITTAMDQAH